MTSNVNPIPEGYSAVTPYLSVDGADKAIQFYKHAFDAVELMRMPGPEGKIGHAEMKIGDSRVMLADEHPQMGFRGPRTLGGTSAHIHLYVRDVDRVVQQAVAAGGTLLREVKDQFYGDRTGSVEDPFGHIWHIATHKEDLTAEELKKRAAEMAECAGQQKTL